MKISRWGFSK